MGDFDGVNGPDLATVNSFTSNVSVLLNLGNGTFGAAANIGMPGTPRTLAVGDLDGVNGPDIAVANETSGAVTVLFSQGNGTFAAPVDFTAGPHQFMGVAMGDANLDGKPDLLLAGRELVVLLNLGGGTFGTPFRYAVFADAVVLADLDGQGRQDLVLVTSTANAVGVGLSP